MLLTACICILRLPADGVPGPREPTRRGLPRLQSAAPPGVTNAEISAVLYRTTMARTPATRQHVAVRLYARGTPGTRSGGYDRESWPHLNESSGPAKMIGKPVFKRNGP